MGKSKCRADGCNHPVSTSFPDGTTTCACHDPWWFDGKKVCREMMGRKGEKK